jgi:hypothetical protein
MNETGNLKGRSLRMTSSINIGDHSFNNNNNNNTSNNNNNNGNYTSYKTKRPMTRDEEIVANTGIGCKQNGGNKIKKPEGFETKPTAYYEGRQNEFYHSERFRSSIRGAGFNLVKENGVANLHNYNNDIAVVIHPERRAPEKFNRFSGY